MAITTIRHNLPAEQNRFIGRERDIGELRGFLDTTRAVTLCGAGGIGKTRLALHVVVTLAGAFPDGAWLVELGDVRQPELVVPRVAATLGVTEEAGRPLLETLVEALRPRRLLLVLDNCEHLVDACARLCKRLLDDVPGLRVLATSREPLRVPAETVWRVQPLSVPPRGRAYPAAGPAGPAPRGTDPVTGSADPVARGADPVTGRADPVARGGDPVARRADPVARGADPVARGADPVTGSADPAPAGADRSPGGTDQVPEELYSYEAISLFVERAAASRPGFALTPRNAGVVAELSRALDGVPLAIELAAARVRALSVEQIAELLTDRFRLLAVGERTAPPRQRTLRATIDWSHTLLTAKEQVLLRRLSVFAGWSLDMAEQVCGDEDLTFCEVLDLLTALVDKSLVVVDGELLGQTRYRLLDSIREYAAERLAVTGETGRLQLRLCDYFRRYLDHAVAIGMGEIAAPWSVTVGVFRRCDADQDNLQQVLSVCLATGDAATGLRMCSALRAYWIARGAFAPGGEWFSRFLALDGNLSAEMRGAALVGRAQLVIATDPGTALRDARAGLELCRRAGAQLWTAAALNLLAEAGLHAGELDAARQHLNEALGISRAIPDGWNEGYALGTQARLAAVQGRLREAQRLGDSALEVMRRIDQQWGVARTLAGLGSVARLRGDPGGARRCYLAALPILREINARPEIARCLAGIGRTALDEGQTGLARGPLAESLRLSQSTGARAGVALGLDSMAALAVALGRGDLAVRLIAAASTLLQSAGFPPFPGARTERYLAPARRHLGEPAVTRLWAEGAALSGDEAVALALDMASGRPDGTGQGEAGQGEAGPEPARPEPADPGAVGLESAGPEPARPKPAGPEPAGLESAGPGAASPHGAGWRGAGSDGTGSDSTGSDGTRRGRGVAAAETMTAGAPPSPLTPREREIAALVARGLTNRAIAGELVISTATVARHVGNILARLGFQSRAQIAAWMAEHDQPR